MVPKSLPEIPTDYQKSNFSIHLKSNNNYRILVSGIFGSGKTTFLKDFFESNVEYEVFHLFPVNYQVASNADIFEYIKYDLLLHIIDKDWIKKDEQIPKKLAWQFYIMNKAPGLFINLLKNIPFKNIDKIAEGFENITSFYKGFLENYHKINRGEFEIIESFAKKLETAHGSIFELDEITQIIYQYINHIKSQKTSVLIIDDLDRMDPEHIFRILNIFSSHFDLHQDKGNKFDFDKIILVCDIHNIRNIFLNKFGSNADFNGYIDKFFSKKIFYFDLSAQINKYIDELLINVSERIENIHFRNILTENVKIIIKCFIKLRLCTVRDLEKFNNTNSPFTKHYNISDQNNVMDYELIFPIIFDFLEEMFGSIFKILHAFEICIKKSHELTILNEDTSKEFLLSNAALMLFSLNNTPNGEKFTFNLNNYTATCSISREHSSFVRSCYYSTLISFSSNGNNRIPSNEDAFIFIHEAFQRFYERKQFAKK